MPTTARDGAPVGSTEPIAIVGVGCRLPGNISSLDELAAALREGRDCITEIPPDRWRMEALHDPDPITLGKTYVRHGGFVSDVDRFDAAFFGISDVEASRMDPQQRIALQCVWHALENAGQSADELLKSNTGVFLAMMNTNNYWQLKTIFEGLRGVTGYDAMGDATSIAAGRISHFLGLEGPCLTLDTACSGSLVALHLARQSILAGECDSAIVAGVSAIFTPHVHIAFSRVGLMSRSGHCKAFDESADGYIRGEGCVAVILRRQSLAVARNDRILASIVGTAVNQDGRTPALTAPNGQTQEKVMRIALDRVGVNPHDIGYVEAHGTGTPVGDPIEMSALVNVYGAGRAESEPLYVGSAKSNFGHIESGAGLLGVVKAALSLDQGTIFPSIHFNRLNPNIDLRGAPVRVPATTVRWPRTQRPRMAGINSFGYSGTNAHAILQEAPAAAVVDASAVRPCEMVVLSAKSAASLQELVDKWTEFLEQDSPTPLRDISFTSATGRTHLRHRLAVIAPTRDEVGEKLHLWREGRMSKGLFAGQTSIGRKQKIAFVFTGQGAQYARMGQQLYDHEPRFKAAIDRCAGHMDGELGASLLDVLFGSDSAKFLDNTRYVQPALFAIEYALADLMGHWGIEPDYVIGHSVGEIVAACVAGVLDLEDAIRFVVARGRLMGQLPRGGKMLAIDAPPEQVREWLQGKESEVSIAAINGPHSVVVSGAAAAVDQVAELVVASGRRAKELEVSHAFHSPLMDPILEELRNVASSLHISAPRIPVVSNLTGDLLTADIGADYWSAHVRQPVLFHQGMRNVIEAGSTVLIEVGPHPALTPSISAAFDTSKTRCVPTLMRDQQDVAHMLEVLASLYVRGVAINTDRIFSGPACCRAALPLYPFRRDRHWIGVDRGIDFPDSLGAEGPGRAKTASAPEVKAEGPAPAKAESQPELETKLHPLLGRAVMVGPRRVVFESTLAATQPWVDHRILGSTVFPGTGYLEMAARGFAASKGQDWQAVVLRNVEFERPLVLSYGKSKKIVLTFDAHAANGSGDTAFAISAAGDGSTETYCRGRAALASESPGKLSIEAERARLQSQVQIGPFYGELRKRGFEYGASFSTIRELWQGNPGSGEAIARITASPRDNGADLHPYTYSTVLDGCLQVFGAALRTLAANDQPGAFVPRSIASVMLRSQPASQVWSHAAVRMNGDGRSLMARIRVVAEGGEVLADIQGLELRQIGKLTLARDENGAATSDRVVETRDQVVARLRVLPKRERVGVLSSWLIAEVKDILGQAAEEIDLDSIDPSTAFLEIGLDSLLVTELQRRIQEKLEFRFKAQEGLDYQTIESLAEYILDEVLLVDAVEKSAAKVAPEPARQVGS
jgi:acyl transferase domain-containing protein